MTMAASVSRRPLWAPAIIVIAVLAVVAAAVVGVRGLTQNPVVGTDSRGVTTLRGEFEPYGCGPRCAEGYVQAGARSVFVILPAGCPAPASGSEITVQARLDTTQGNATYRTATCP